MKTVTIHQAKTHLSRLLQVARLVPFRAPETTFHPGMFRDDIWIADDFDAPDPELIAEFEEGPIEPDRRPRKDRA
jgi:antitoxin (DNA-binding transcriptional repressor) of toxin-antitoxin stability system